MDKSTIILICFLIYVGLMILVGFWVSKKQSTGDDFLLGGRNVPVFLLIGTTVATLIGTGSSMGAVGYGYVNGWAGALYGIGGGVGVILLILLFADARKDKFITMSEEISFYYKNNKFIKAVVSLIIYIASVGWLGAHMLGGSMYLAAITNTDLLTAKIITAVGFGIYVIVGGYMAVVWTDLIQAIILFIGFIVMLVVSLNIIGGYSGITNTVTPEALTFLGIGKLGVLPALSLVVVIAVGVLAGPSYRHRIYSGKDVKSVKKSFAISAVFYFVFSIIPALVGMATFVINPNLDKPNFAFPYLALEILPLWAGTLILIAGLSATMSSGDSDAMAGVTILITDIYETFTNKKIPQEKTIKYSRVGLILTLGLAFSFAAGATNIISYISKMVSTIMSGLLICSILGKYWKKATWQGGIASILGGSAISLYINGNKALSSYWGNSIIPALLVALLLGVIISFITYKAEEKNTSKTL